MLAISYLRGGLPLYAKFSYWQYRHSWLNLTHPRTFDEKLWWLKLHYQTPLMTECTDKLRVRDYVTRCGLGDTLNELYGHWNKAEDIAWNALPNEFFLKCNHTSGGNALCQRDSCDRRKLTRQFRALLQRNVFYATFEKNYRDIKPCIIAERVLHRRDGKPLLDYKFLCMGGEPRLLFLDIGVCKDNGDHAEEYCRNVYDMEFNPMDITETRPHYDYTKIERPACFERMKEIARTLSKPFPHVRVDLYDVDGQVVFGELTFYHGSGYNRVEPHEADIWLGSLIDITPLQGR